MALPGLSLRPYQAQQLAFHIAHSRSLNLSDPGVGKTPVAALYSWWVASRINQATVWIQPTSLNEKNKEEILNFSKFKEHEVQIVQGTPAERQQIYRHRPKVLLITPETFGREWRKILEHQQVGAVVTDEHHKSYASNNSKRTEQWYFAMRHIPRFLGMTGTIIAGRYNTLYPAIHVIEPRYYLTEVSFTSEHAILDGFGNICGWRNDGKLRAILANHSVRTTFEEAYGPEAKIIFPPEHCEMSPRQAAMYKDLEDKALIELEDRFVDAALPGVNAIRARQVLGCPEVFEPNCVAGRDASMALHFDNPGNFAVFSCFPAEVERMSRLATQAGRRSAFMHGGVPAAQRANIDQVFREGRLDTVCATIEVAGQGFNWHHLDDIFYLSMDYKDDGFFQSYRRGIRGQRSKPLRIHILNHNSRIENRILEVIERKSREANAVDQSREVLSLRRV